MLPNRLLILPMLNRLLQANTMYMDRMINLRETNRIKEAVKYAVIFLVGGTVYGLIEVSFRGFTHWSMVLTGGACTLTLYFIQMAMPSLNIFLKALLGAAVITLYEFSVGCIVNLWFRLGVWDYSDRAFSLYGQICPLFSLIWFLLCLCLAAAFGFYYNRVKNPGTKEN